MFLCTTQRIFQKCRDHRVLFIQCHLITLRRQKERIFAHACCRINRPAAGLFRLGRTNQHFMLQSAIRDTVEHIFEVSLISQSETCQRHSLRTEKNCQIFSLFFCNAIACTSGKGFRHISLSAFLEADYNFITHFFLSLSWNSPILQWNAKYCNCGRIFFTKTAQDMIYYEKIKHTSKEGYL